MLDLAYRDLRFPRLGAMRGGGGFSPAGQLLPILLSSAAQLIMHPLEYGGMFQDRAGTIPVTASGQLLGRCLDTGPGGYHAEAVSDAARGIFRDVGGKRWIEYNGVNTAYQTPVLPAPGVDKAQVFAGVRKLSDAVSIMAELSSNTAGNPGAFYLVSGSDTGILGIRNGYTLAARGSLTLTAAGISQVIANAPDTAVLSGTIDIATDANLIRRNGVNGTASARDFGTGNFNPSGTYRLYYGARAGASLFFNGNHYRTLGPIVRFSAANATAEQIAAAEAFYTEGSPA